MKKTNNQIIDKVENFINTLKLRHSEYGLINDSILSDAQLIKFIQKCIYYHPSAFNVQSTRMVLLLNENVYKIWDHVLNVIPKNMPEILVSEIKNCRDAYATILFFDDLDANKSESDKRHIAMEHFEDWGAQSMAMLQNVLWNGLSYFGYGVNIQHFNKELSDYLTKEFGFHDHWKLLSQMNIGTYTKNTSERTRLPINHLLIVRR